MTENDDPVTRNNDAKYREERKKSTLERLATTLYVISRASPRPLAPPEAYQQAEAFVEHTLKRDPDSRLDIP